MGVLKLDWMMKKKWPDFSAEKYYWERGHLVIGVDEVGRGAWAGPVVAGAAAIFNLKFEIFKDIGIDDSKRLTAERKEELARIINKNAAVGIGEVGVGFINRFGIVRATEKAMRLAIKNLIAGITVDQIPKRNVFVLVDAFHVKYIPGVGLANQKAFVKGDQKSISIAAASIVAKVYRDRLIKKLARKNKKYRNYLWEENKGYGTSAHQRAIKKHGLTRLHRKAFVKV